MRTSYIALVLICFVVMALGQETELIGSSFTGDSFSEADGWNVANKYNNNLITTCGKDRLFGGYGRFAKGTSAVKQYLNLPPHYQVKVQFYVFKIDSWDGEAFLAYADGNKIYQNNFKYHQGSQICGQGHNKWNEQKVKVEVTFNHNSQSIVFVLTSTLNQGANDESWGFNNFQIWVTKCDPSCAVCDGGPKKECDGFKQVASSWMNNNVGSEGWQISGGQNKVYTCSGVQIFGGYGNFGKGAQIQKTFDNLGQHTRLLIQLQFWKVDSWDKNEKAFLIVDGKTVWAGELWKFAPFPVTICGRMNGWKEDIIDLDIALDHTSPSATIQITTSINQGATDESWGVREFQLFTKNTGITDYLFESDFVTNNFNEGEGWAIIQPYSNNPFTNCGSVRLFGGYGVFGKGSAIHKIFGLPPHYAIRIEFKLFKIDSWDNQIFYLYVDGKNYYNKKFHYTTGTQQCGVNHVNYQEQLEQVKSDIPHNMHNLVVTMTTNLDEAANNESWGIRDFQLFVAACPKGCDVCDNADAKACTSWKKFEYDYILNDSTFGNEGWSVKNANPAITRCSGVYLFGGYNAFGNGVTITKTFDKLPQHKGIRVKMQFWKLDSWDNEWAYMNADGNRIWQQQYQVASGFPANICGSPHAGWRDQITDVDVSLQHDANQVVILIGSTVNQNAADESWGIRDFEIFIEDGSLTDADDLNMTSGDWWYTAWGGNNFTDLDGWTVTNAYSQPVISSCGPYKMVGGFNILGKNSAVVKAFTLPPHYKMKIRIKFFKIDSWDKETFQIYVDGVNVYTQQFVYSQGSQICGQGHAKWNEVMEVFEIEFEHNNVDAIVILTSTLNQAANDESWGVKNFRIGLTECPKDCSVCDLDTLKTCQTWKLAEQDFLNPTNKNEGWSIGSAQSKATNCAGINLFGGYGVFGKGASMTKEFKNLATHNILRIRVQFWKLDSWDNEQARIYLDGVLIWNKKFNVAAGFPAHICGRSNDNWNEAIADVDLTVDSSNSSPKITITSTINQGSKDESWGVRDFQLFTGQLQPVQDPGADDANIFYKSFQGNTFDDLDGWTVVNAYSDPVFSACGGVRMIGGFNVFGKDSSLSQEFPLPPHYSVQVRFTVFKIDSWDNEQFLLYLDGQQVYNPKYKAHKGQQICGQGHNNWNEQTYTIDVTVDHRAPSLVVMLTTTLNQGAQDESWGMRNFQLLVSKCPSDCDACTKETSQKSSQCSMWQLRAQDFVQASQETWEGWQVQNAKPKFTYCSGARMFGGFGVFGKGATIQKKFTGLKKHNRMIIRTQFWKIDSWDNEQAILQVDGDVVWKKNLKGGFANTICGNAKKSWTDDVIDIEVLLDHTAPAATLKFSTTINQGSKDESWGISDVQLITELVQDVDIDKELQEHDQLFYSAFLDNDFNDAPGWVTVGQENNNAFTACGGIRLYGGYRVFGAGSSSTLFLDPPPHFLVRIKFTLYQIDSWDNEKFLMYVDGDQIFDINSQHQKNAQNKCGASPTNWKESIVSVDETFEHNGPTLQITLTSTLNQAAADESWGIRDFYVFVENCPKGCSVCTKGTLETCSDIKLISSSWTQNKDPQGAEGWSIANAADKNVATSCAGVQLLGGYGVFGKGAKISKTFSKLPVHNKLIIRFQFWKLDSWDNEYAQLLVDGKQAWGQQVKWNMGFKSNVCGRMEKNWNEYVNDFQVVIDHADPDVNLVFTSNVNQGAKDESWGIRNFELYYPVVEDDSKVPDTFYAAFFSQSFVDSEGWAVTNNYQNDLVTACGNIRVLGGYGVFGKQSTMVKQFVLPPHYLININFNLLKIDSWDNEKMLVYVDEQQAYNQQLGLKDGEQLCGVENAKYLEQLVKVSISVKHNAPTVVVAITSTLNEAAGNESWGIRDFTLDLKECPDSCKVCDWGTRNSPEVCDNWKLFATSLTALDGSKLDIQDWNVQNGQRAVSTCSGISVFGGYGNFAKVAVVTRTFTDLPNHNNVRIQLQFWKIDSWDNEWFSVYVDNTKVYTKQFKVAQGLFSTVCGHSNQKWTEQIVDIDVDTNHVGSSLTLKLLSNLNEGATNESWGFRDVAIYTEEITSTTPTKPTNPAFYEAFMTNEFTGLSDWQTVNAQSDQLITSCGNDRIYGGFGVFGAKAVVTKEVALPPHTSVSIKFKLYKIDSWDDHVFLTYIDGVQVVKQKYQWKQGSDICGNEMANQWKEQISYVEIKDIPHTSPTVLITMTSTLDQHAKDESWGIKEFQLWVDQCPKDCTTCSASDKTTDDCSIWKQVDQSFINVNDPKNNGWTTVKALDKFTTCGGVTIFGGYGVFGKGSQVKKIETNLPSHNVLRLKVQFWKIDTWDNELAQILVDGVVVWQQKFTNANKIAISMCGNGGVEDVVDIEVDVDHSSSTADILIRTTINQGSKDESWGIRNYQLFTENTSDAVTKTKPNAFYTAFTSETFTSTDGWVFNDAQNEEVISSCDGQRLLGGYGVLGKGSTLFKEIALPPHSEVQLIFNLFKIDSWDKEKFILYIDGVAVMKKAYTYSQGIQACGRQNKNWNDAVEKVNVKVDHTMPTLIITMTTTLNENANNESWGIRDFQLLMTPCPSGCKICGKNYQKCQAWEFGASDWLEPSNLKAEGWKVENGKVGTNSCSGVEIFGGYGLFGKGAKIKKTFNLPTHNSILIRLQFWKIDSWDKEYARVYVDGYLLWNKQLYGGADNICGNQNKGWKENIYDVELIADHTNPNPTIVITSTINQNANDESWGVRDFEIYYYNQPNASEDKPNPKAVVSNFFGNSFTEADGWMITNQYKPEWVDNTNPFSSCGGTRLFGGYGKLGYGAVVSKQFSLPPHSQVALSFELFKIDSWDNEVFFLYGDSQLLTQKQFKYTQGTQQCGTSHKHYMDTKLLVQAAFVHNFPTLTVIMTSSLNEDANNESWGFREFQIAIEKCPDGCLTCTPGQAAGQCNSWVLFTSDWTANEGLTLEGWVPQGNFNPQATTCGDVTIFGGYDQFGKGASLQKVFFNMPPHTKLLINFQAWAVDSWDNERLALYMDGKEAWGKNFQYKKGIYRSFCGQVRWPDQFADAQIQVSHNLYTMTLEFQSSVNQGANDESWGIRQLEIYSDVVDASVDPEKPVYSAFMKDTISADEISGWIINNPAQKKSFVTQCGSQQIFGGYNVFGKGAQAILQKDLNPHYQITVSFNFFKVDSWDQEQFLVYIDGQQVYNQYFSLYDGTQQCGTGGGIFVEQKQFVSITIPHNRPQVMIMLSSTVNQGAKDESWGIRDFQIQMRSCPSGCVVCDNDNESECLIWKNQEADWSIKNFNADGWQAVHAGAQTSSCSGIQLFGGYKIFGTNSYIKKTFQSLPVHQRLRIQLQFWKIDSWDDERAALFVDGKEVWNHLFAFQDGYTQQLCGVGGFYDEIFDIDVQIPHTSNTAEIEIRTTIDQGAADESWGVKGFYIYTGQCYEGCFDCVGNRKEDCLVPDETTEYYSAFVGTDWDNNDMEGWTVLTPYSKNYVTTCKDYKIFGGYNVLAKNSALTTVIQLPPHYLLRVQFNFYKIDSWDNEAFYLYLDGESTYREIYKYSQGTQLCGNGHKELLVPIDITIEHNSPTVIVVMQTTLNENGKNESWGISDFVLSIEKCPDGCVTCNDKLPQNCLLWNTVDNYWDTNGLLMLDGWLIQGAKGNQYTSNCGGINMIGGYNVFGKGALMKRYIPNLPQHSMIKIKMQIWKLDSWDWERFDLTVDGLAVWQDNFHYWGGYIRPLCGVSHQQWNEQTIDIEVTIPHNRDDMTVLISTTLNQDASDESWGVRQIDIFMAQCPNNCVTCLSSEPDTCLSCTQPFILQEGKCVQAQQQLIVSQSFTEKQFNTLSGWTVTGKKGSVYTSLCGDVSLLGGYGIYGKGAQAKKTFDLSEHTTLRIQLQLWKIDSWDNEEIFILVDGQKVWERHFGFSQNNVNSLGPQYGYTDQLFQQCGQQHYNWDEVIVNVDFTIEHSRDQANLVIASTINEDANNESWGFREFYLSIESTEDCAYFYSECNYKGDYVKFCRETRNSLKTNFLPDIKSFKIPPQGKVNVYKTVNFEVKAVELTESDECVDEGEISLTPKQQE